MSPSLSLLLDLYRRGVALTLAVSPARTIHATPASVLTSQDRESIRSHKDALLGLLAGGFNPESVVHALGEAPPNWEHPPGPEDQRMLVSLQGRLVAFSAAMVREWEVYNAQVRVRARGRVPPVAVPQEDSTLWTDQSSLSGA